MSGLIFNVYSKKSHFDLQPSVVGGYNMENFSGFCPGFPKGVEGFVDYVEKELVRNLNPSDKKIFVTSSPPDDYGCTKIPMDEMKLVIGELKGKLPHLEFILRDC
ncbi:MAG TPA: hypothetical protein VJZ93_02060 [Candidatus Nanoarchaeia archaeon]|nr:hypothetical protein [Candidatus Nanoarchaeia archaeon]